MMNYKSDHSANYLFKYCRNITRFSTLSLALAAVATATYASEQHATENMGEVTQAQTKNDGMVTGNIFDVDNLAYYGDWDSNRIYIIDVDSMSLLVTVEGTGDGPYGIDQQGADKAYALTRKTESLTVVDNNTLENAGQIPLAHKPRSTHYSAETGLTLVSGGDKAMSSIIKVDVDEVIRVVGEDLVTSPIDFGGSLSTGHPLWVNNNHFFMLDRAAREIQFWNRDGELLSVLQTPTSIHHLFQVPADLMTDDEKEVYYAVVEGNQNELISPAILRFEILGTDLIQTGLVYLNSYDPDNLDPAVMGAHHADFHPDGINIYVGSAEGHTFVVNKDTLSVDKMIETGTGAGHTTFLPARDQAIVTNHNATFVTVINTINHKKVRDVEVATSASPDYKSQAHTSGVSLDSKYFYSTASHDGVFFRIDMDTWEVTKTYIGGNLLMGSFIWNGEGINM
ncbi:MAG: hypothetical protein ABFR65_00175 [Pseudomonadota bacterium]